MQKFDQISLMGIEAAIKNYPIGTKVKFVRDRIKQEYIGDAKNEMTVVSSLPRIFITDEHKLLWPAMEPKEYVAIAGETEDVAVATAVITEQDVVPKSVYYKGISDMADKYPIEIFEGDSNIVDTRIQLPCPMMEGALAVIVGKTPLKGIFVAKQEIIGQPARHFIFSKYSDWLQSVSSTVFNMLKE